MAKLTYAQLEGLWTQNGGSAALAPIMAAIALAESSGNPSATNPNDNGGRQTSWGLWQLSDGTHNQPVSNILDPNVNAAQAVKKYKSQGLKAWGTYTSGAYKKFLQNGVPASTSGITGTSSTANQAGVVSDIGGDIGKGFADAFASLFKPVINMLVWGTEALLGLAFLVAGVLIMVSNTDTGKRAGAQIGKDALAVAEPETELM
jgi:Lysozyme like domain